MIGKQFDRLTVVSAAPSRDKKRSKYWLCRCACGREITIRHDHLTGKRIVSCGCVRDEKIASVNASHGHTRGYRISVEFRTWAGMIQRCSNPNNPSFPKYGGRGISVCDRWRKFDNFLADMGPRPRGRSIDRIDVNGPYSPQNCRWATPRQQNRNKRNNVNLTFDGRTMCAAEWAAEVGINAPLLRRRIQKGWPTERALVTAPRAKRVRRCMA